jgi:hypothetical protein
MLHGLHRYLCEADNWPTPLEMTIRHKMSLMRQGFITEFGPKLGVLIATLAYDYPANYLVTEHAHASHQLVYAARGVMEVSAGRSFWLLPPRLAIWIPAKVKHSIRMPVGCFDANSYIRRGLAPRLPDVCAVLHVVRKRGCIRQNG